MLEENGEVDRGARGKKGEGPRRSRNAGTSEVEHRRVADLYGLPSLELSSGHERRGEGGSGW